MHKTRVRSLFAKMTPWERARAQRQAQAQGLPLDPLIRTTLPRAQYAAFDAASRSIAHLEDGCIRVTALITADVRMLEAQAATLLVVAAWVGHCEAIETVTLHGAPTIVTASGHEQRATDILCATWAAATVLATHVAVQRTPRDHDDVDEGLVPWTETAPIPHGIERDRWQATVQAARRSIQQAINDGDLLAKKRRGQWMIQLGSFAEWFGEPVPILSPDGGGYRVVQELSRAKEDQEQRDRIRPVLAHGPQGAWDLEASPAPNMGAPDQLARAILTSLPDAIQYQQGQLVALIAVLDGVASEHGGLDPLPHFRTKLSELRERLDALVNGIAPWSDPLPWPEAAAKDIARLRAALVQPEA